MATHCTYCGSSLRICPECGKIGCNYPECGNDISRKGFNHLCAACDTNLRDLADYKSEKESEKRDAIFEQERERSSSSSNSSPNITYVSRGEPTVFTDFLDLAFISAVVAFVAFITIWVFVNVKVGFGCAVAIWAIMTAYMSWHKWFKPKPIRERIPNRGGAKARSK